VTTAYKNTVLRNISAEAIKRLELEPVTLPNTYSIKKPGDEIHNLYFIESAVGSMTNTLATDRIDLTHEFLAQMLGIRRTSVTITAIALQDLGDYKRGKITITDRQGLEKMACECFRVVRDHLNNYHEVETGFRTVTANYCTFARNCAT
jgi:hypothetical protein